MDPRWYRGGEGGGCFSVDEISVANFRSGVANVFVQFSYISLRLGDFWKGALLNILITIAFA